MIHVCYMTNDGYCAPTAVSAVSVFENHRDEDVCVHVLTEFVSHENENLLLQAAEPYPRGTVCLHNCDEYIRQIREEYRPTGWKGTCNAYLYMFMEEIFPDLDRVLWIDGDTIIRRSLRDLWQTDLQGKLLGGVLDVPAFTSAWPDDPFYHTPFYFNGGVLLFNLEECRRRHIDAVLQKWVKQYGSQFRFPDQTLLNLAVRPEDVVRLPLRYDFPVGMNNRVLSMVAGYHMSEKPTFLKETIQNERGKRRDLSLYWWTISHQTLVFGMYDSGKRRIPFLPRTLAPSRAASKNDERERKSPVFVLFPYL